MNLSEALLETGIAETEYDGYVATVKDEMGEFGDKLLLTIQQGGMPPFYSEELDNVEDIEREMQSTHAPHPLNWESVEAE